MLAALSNCLSHKKIEFNCILLSPHDCREFCTVVKRIFICSREDLKKMKCCKLPASSSEVEEILLSPDSQNRDETQQSHMP